MFTPVDRSGVMMELPTIQETARLLRVTPVTVRRYIHDGRLPAVRVGRGVRVEKEAAIQLITPVGPQTTPPAEPIPPGRPLTYDDPFWQLVGSVNSGGPGDVAENKHKYLAGAYLPTRG
jgi:excisionase family DNA binding protein